MRYTHSARRQELQGSAEAALALQRTDPDCTLTVMLTCSKETVPHARTSKLPDLHSCKLDSCTSHAQPQWQQQRAHTWRCLSAAARAAADARSFCASRGSTSVRYRSWRSVDSRWKGAVLVGARCCGEMDRGVLPRRACRHPSGCHRPKYAGTSSIKLRHQCCFDTPDTSLQDRQNSLLVPCGSAEAGQRHAVVRTCGEMGWAWNVRRRAASAISVRFCASSCACCRSCSAGEMRWNGLTRVTASVEFTRRAASRCSVQDRSSRECVRGVRLRPRGVPAALLASGVQDAAALWDGGDQLRPAERGRVRVALLVDR